MNLWKSVVAVLLGLLLSATACAADYDLFSQTPTPDQINQTFQPLLSDKLMGVGESTEPVITLVLIQSDNTKMPGPRDMAFGPTSISIATTRSSLIVFSLLAFASFVGLFLLRRCR